MGFYVIFHSCPTSYSIALFLFVRKAFFRLFVSHETFTVQFCRHFFIQLHLFRYSIRIIFLFLVCVLLFRCSFVSLQIYFLYNLRKRRTIVLTIKSVGLDLWVIITIRTLFKNNSAKNSICPYHSLLSSKMIYRFKTLNLYIPSYLYHLWI